jgi:hypothetical protein
MQDLRKEKTNERWFEGCAGEERKGREGGVKGGEGEVSLR